MSLRGRDVPWRAVAFAGLSVAVMIGSGWLYQTQHLVPAAFEAWPALKTLRDVALTALAILWIFYPSRVLTALILAGLFGLSAILAGRPTGVGYWAMAVACVGTGVLATRMRRGMASAFGQRTTTARD